jgi:hypothetical protein
MAKELFVVSENDEKELFVVAENELSGDWNKADKFMGGAGAPTQQAPQNEKPDDWINSRKIEKFMEWFVGKLRQIQHPSAILGNKTKMEKALGQYIKLNREVSKALRSDFDDVLDTTRVDELRSFVEKAIDTLEDSLYGIEKMKRRRKQMKRRGSEENGEMVKEGTAPHFGGMVISVSPFIRGIAGLLINGKVANGRNMEELFEEIKKKYDLDKREELEVLQVVADMGYPIYRDRAKLNEDTTDPTREDNFGEWATIYYA